MSQAVVTIRGVLGVLVLTLLLGTGFGADVDFCRPHPAVSSAASSIEDKAASPRERTADPATPNRERP